MVLRHIIIIIFVRQSYRCQEHASKFHVHTSIIWRKQYIKWSLTLAFNMKLSVNQHCHGCAPHAQNYTNIYWYLCINKPNTCAFQVNVKMRLKKNTVFWLWCNKEKICGNCLNQSALWRNTQAVEVQIHAFLTPAFEEDDELHSLATFTLHRSGPSDHWRQSKVL
jgi:hypothetical protein